MPKNYQEPELSFLILDYKKPEETYSCLKSIKEFVKFPHKVIYYHNGKSDNNIISYFNDGLVDLFIQISENNGLGIGTRDLFAICKSKYAIYLQNDQKIIRDFNQVEFDWLKSTLGKTNPDTNEICSSISLAGQICGENIYSERAHLIETKFYLSMETDIPLANGGAGPFHHEQWREGQIQKFYKENGYFHFTKWPPLVADMGVWTRRTCAGGEVVMRTDTKEVFWIKPPTHEYIFPAHTSEEWVEAIAGKWSKWKIPFSYTLNGESFNCWGNQEYNE